ncbi:TerC family protein [Paenibacillus sp. JX-17]|uniref:TerC family protein n=1 Tax=Paenibacillus lacisoli TaxID=3064525 RepID=A0ABT9C847_9BACL|nr:TerC family protein [Paenibacillus sp. JX-17]MDO7905432.1 TerC family protein [Paenibacillus sp. JX-17]
MEIFSLEFMLLLLNVIFIDLMLAGDNAIVIGMAARKLPKETQKKAILYGTGGAVIIRILATIVVLWLLSVPWLRVVGGILLVWIAYKLVAEEEEHTEVQAGTSLWAAVRTIVVADAAMGLDNVLAVAGAAKQHLILVILGLLISVPIVVWGSTLFIKLINRFPWIMYLGAAVLAYTAANMITEEKRFTPYFEEHPTVRYGLILIVVAGVLLAGYAKNRRAGKEKHRSYS